MTTRPFALFPLLASLAVACGDPCLPTYQADTLIVAPADICWLTTDQETSDPSESSGTGSTSVSTTGAGVCQADSECGVGEICDLSVAHCIPDPTVCELAPGLPWGPCDDGVCYGEAVFCLHTTDGSICAPACKDESCPDLGCSNPGVCAPTGACVPSCSQGCEEGQACDAATDTCVWPADICVPAGGALWGPCLDGACQDGQCVAGPGGETLCAPTCVGGDPCTPDACGPPSPAPLCQTSGICGYACDPEHPCAAGHACVAQGPVSVCMWQ